MQNLNLCWLVYNDDDYADMAMQLVQCSNGQAPGRATRHRHFYQPKNGLKGIWEFKLTHRPLRWTTSWIYWLSHKFNACPSTPVTASTDINGFPLKHKRKWKLQKLLSFTIQAGGHTCTETRQHQHIQQQSPAIAGNSNDDWKTSRQALLYFLGVGWKNLHAFRHRCDRQHHRPWTQISLDGPENSRATAGHCPCLPIYRPSYKDEVGGQRAYLKINTPRVLLALSSQPHKWRRKEQ